MWVKYQRILCTFIGLHCLHTLHCRGSWQLSSISVVLCSSGLDMQKSRMLGSSVFLREGSIVRACRSHRTFITDFLGGMAMDGYSPRTSVRYGLSRVDSDGNIVSVWNWPDFDSILHEIESETNEADSVQEAGGALGDGKLLSTGTLDIVPRVLAEDPIFKAAITGLCSTDTEGLGMSPPLFATAFHGFLDCGCIERRFSG